MHYTTANKTQSLSHLLTLNIIILHIFARHVYSQMLTCD